jgi:PAS domain S-box-containing protein
VLGWARLAGERANLFGPEVSVALVVLATAVILAVLIWFAARSLAKADAKRRRAQEALRASEERTRLIVDTAYDAFIAIDVAGRVTDWNRQAEVIFGWPREEAVGQLLVSMIIPPQYRDAHVRGLSRFLETGEGPVLNSRIEITALHRDGREFPVQITIWPVRVGRTWSFNAFVSDITERRRTEEALAQQADELARSNADLEQFAYVASHDLQEPLRMVASYVQLLAQRYQGKLGADADEFIAFAVSGATRMQALINDLLAYSRVGSTAQAAETTDSQQVLKRVLGDLKMAITESDAVVTHDPLPQVATAPTHLAQLFQNLVTNALKFRGPQQPHIHVGASRLDGEWTFSVSDNGIGFDPKYADRIFMIFQRLHNRAAYPGTGIGLAICKKIVEHNGGRIWAESEPGKGSTFKFTLPVPAEETT